MKIPLPTVEELLEMGVHLGHHRSKWHPAMKNYILAEKNKIHLINVLKTRELLAHALEAISLIAERGHPILFVGTKKQAREILRQAAQTTNMPYVTERWLGGMLTNYKTIRRSINKLESIERMEKDGTFEKISKKERLLKLRERDKLLRLLGGIARTLTLPIGGIYIVDIVKEHIALAEAQRLNIPSFALVDTNADPRQVTYPIPANDDSTRSIELITSYVVKAIQIGQAKQAQLVTE